MKSAELKFSKSFVLKLHLWRSRKVTHKMHLKKAGGIQVKGTQTFYVGEVTVHPATFLYCLFTTSFFTKVDFSPTPLAPLSPSSHSQKITLSPNHYAI